jgi:hypothetical protein
VFCLTSIEQGHPDPGPRRRDRAERRDKTEGDDKERLDRDKFLSEGVCKELELITLHTEERFGKWHTSQQQ